MQQIGRLTGDDLLEFLLAGTMFRSSSNEKKTVSVLYNNVVTVASVKIEMLIR